MHYTCHAHRPSLGLQETARHVAEVSVDCKLDVDAEEYVQSFRPSLMDVVYAWSKGAPFGSAVCLRHGYGRGWHDLQRHA